VSSLIRCGGEGGDAAALAAQLNTTCATHIGNRHSKFASPAPVAARRQRHPTKSKERRFPISGVFYIGLGDQFDAGKLQAYPPGSVIILPGNTSHFHWAKTGEYITQVTAIGPLGLEYVDAKDDPRDGSS